MIDEPLYQDYLTALLAGDRARCAALVDRLLEDDIVPETIYTDLFQRSLYRVGELWEQNRVSVAVEHLATAITESLLAGVYPRILADRTPNGRRAVVSCGANEFHQVGARMVADILEHCGWDVWFLGANTPAEELLPLIEEKRPDAVGLSLSVYFSLARLTRMIEVIRSHHPGLDILVGGQAFRWAGAATIAREKRVAYIPSLEDLRRDLGAGAGR